MADETEAQRKAREDAEAAEKAAAEAAEEAKRLAAYEAQARLQLHAQAVAVANVKTMIPFVLEQTSTNYNRWRSFFLNTVSKYDLECLVLSDEDFSGDSHWHRMDCTVKSWLYSTVSPDLLEVVSTTSPTSRSIWLGLEEQFLGNKETRALLIDAEFRTLVQGDLPVTEYCRRLKSMADALSDLGEPTSDRTLVLMVIRGLNDKFSYMGALIKRTRPLPPFRDVLADLQIEEATMATKVSTPTALVTTSSSASTPAPRAPSPHQSGGAAGGASGAIVNNKPGGSGGGSGGYTNNRTRRRWRRNDGASTSAATGPHAWQPTWNPFTGTFMVWPSSTPPRGAAQPGVLGRPPQGPAPQRPQAFAAGHTGAQQQQPHSPYGTLAQYVPQHYGAPVPPPMPYMYQQPYMWDQQALANSFHTMTLAPPPTNEWIMDSGASSHMTSNSGPRNEERDRQVQ